MVRMLVRMLAQVLAGNAGCPVRQGTGVAPNPAKPVMMGLCAEVGRKIAVLVSVGEKSCPVEWRLSKPTNPNVLSGLVANPKNPPNCCWSKFGLTGDEVTSCWAGS